MLCREQSALLRTNRSLAYDVINTLIDPALEKNTPFSIQRLRPAADSNRALLEEVRQDLLRATNKASYEAALTKLIDGYKHRHPAPIHLSEPEIVKQAKVLLQNSQRQPQPAAPAVE